MPQLPEENIQIQEKCTCLLIDVATRCMVSSASALMRALVMTSVVLRRVRNCLRIIVIKKTRVEKIRCHLVMDWAKWDYAKWEDTFNFVLTSVQIVKRKVCKKCNIIPVS